MCLTYTYIVFYYSNLLFNSLCVVEVGISKASRSRKRLGGGGYGQFNNMNDPSAAKRMKRTKTFRHINKPGQDNRQFGR